MSTTPHKDLSVRLPLALWMAAKVQADTDGRSLGDLIRDSIREHLVAAESERWTYFVQDGTVWWSGPTSEINRAVIEATSQCVRLTSAHRRPVAEVEVIAERSPRSLTPAPSIVSDESCRP